MSLLRPRTSAPARVTFVELFFDLVFVFAVTQVSHALLEHFTPLGVFETALLLMAVWWVWIYTSWLTNWLEPEREPVRLMLLALMLAGLVLSTSLPKAFETRGLAFAGAYVAMQVGRSLFMLWAVRGHVVLTANFQRILVWFAASGVFWIAGALAGGSAQIALWALAVAIEYLGPAFGFRAPGLGRSDPSGWNVEGHHLAERCGLFVIIALGESILVTGATFAKLDWTAATIAAFVQAFVGSVAMWWIYFDRGQGHAGHRIAHEAVPGRLARSAYTYLHLPIVAGIVVAAVADELVVAHPTGHADARTVIAAIGGPALYLLGVIGFKRNSGTSRCLSHYVGVGLLALLAIAEVATGALSPLALASGATLILLLVAGWERWSLGAP